MAWLLEILSAVGGFLLKLFQRPAVVVEAEKAGAAEQAVKGMEAEDVQTTKASTAVDTVVRDVGSDSGLHKYESTDPNNRDNS